LHITKHDITSREAALKMTSISQYKHYYTTDVHATTVNRIILAV